MSPYIVIILTLIFSAFFSGMEIAFVTANKLKFELDKKQNKNFTKILNIFFNNPSQYIATMLVGNNISLVIYGLFTAKILDPFLQKIIHNEWGVLLTETLISTIIILVFAEFMPKTIFRILPNFFLKIFSIPLIFFYLTLYIIAKFAIIISDLFLRFFKKDLDTSEDDNVFRKVDIDSLFLSNEEKEHIDEEDDGINLKLFQNALDFSDIKLRDCMIPRTDIVAIEQNDTIEKLSQLFIESGFSKILIYKESIDNIIGYAHSLDLFRNPKSIKNITHHLTIAPESMNADKLLSLLTSENKSLALVVDEFGGTAGIVTVEDIIEEIFGEIEDEFDQENELEIIISDTEYKFSARLEIDYLNEKYQLNLPDSDEYETLAGFILSEHNNIPQINEVINIESFVFTIIDVNNTRIEAVYLKIDK